MKPDPVLGDALFLVAHPGWSWRDLEEAPADVVALIRTHDLEQAHESRRRR